MMFFFNLKIWIWNWIQAIHTEQLIAQIFIIQIFVTHPREVPHPMGWGSNIQEVGGLTSKGRGVVSSKNSHNIQWCVCQLKKSTTSKRGAGVSEILGKFRCFTIDLISQNLHKIYDFANNQWWSGGCGCGVGADRNVRNILSFYHWISIIFSIIFPTCQHPREWDGSVRTNLIINICTISTVM